MRKNSLLNFFLRAHPQIDEAVLKRPGNPDLADIVEQNIAAIIERRQRMLDARNLQDRIADAITQFSGSMAFLYIHILWFLVWILLNVGIVKVKPFDPFPFGFLTLVVSLEAIFLSTFVLISQNRMSDAAEEKADLDLQINLLAEHEISRILRLVDAMAEQMGVAEAFDPSLDALKADTRPETVLDEIQIRRKNQKRSQ